MRTSACRARPPRQQRVYDLSQRRDAPNELQLVLGQAVEFGRCHSPLADQPTKDRDELAVLWRARPLLAPRVAPPGLLSRPHELDQHALADQEGRAIGRDHDLYHALITGFVGGIGFELAGTERGGNTDDTSAREPGRIGLRNNLGLLADAYVGYGGFDDFSTDDMGRRGRKIKH